MKEIYSPKVSLIIKKIVDRHPLSHQQINTKDIGLVIKQANLYEPTLKEHRKGGIESVNRHVVCDSIVDGYRSEAVGYLTPIRFVVLHPGSIDVSQGTPVYRADLAISLDTPARAFGEISRRLEWLDIPIIKCALESGVIKPFRVNLPPLSFIDLPGDEEDEPYRYFCTQAERKNI